MAIAAGAKIDQGDFSIKTWTPTFNSMTLGTGYAVTGWYTNVGGLVTGAFYLVFGTSPAFTATGYMDLPVTANVTGLQMAFGSWVYRDVSAVTHYAGTLAGWDSGGAQAGFSGAWNATAALPHGRIGGTGVLGNNPAVAVGDILSAQFSYRAA